MTSATPFYTESRELPRIRGELTADVEIKVSFRPQIWGLAYVMMPYGHEPDRRKQHGLINQQTLNFVTIQDRERNGTL